MWLHTKHNTIFVLFLMNHTSFIKRFSLYKHSFHQSSYIDLKLSINTIDWTDTLAKINHTNFDKSWDWNVLQNDILLNYEMQPDLIRWSYEMKLNSTTTKYKKSSMHLNRA